MTLLWEALQFRAVCLEDVMCSGDASPRARQSSICFSRDTLAKDAYFVSTPWRAISSISNWYHRYGYWVVEPVLDSTTTGIPHSKLRSVFRDKSKKFEKFDTHATSTGALSMHRTPLSSSSNSWSTSRRSTSEASSASSISVTPSCFPKSSVWFPINAAAWSVKRARSTLLTEVRWSLTPSKSRRWSRRPSISPCNTIPFSLPKLSYVGPLSPLSTGFPAMHVATGSSYHFCASKRSQ
mmetsp:Transcript_16034/g.47168  ORF Transcript_16034/g.47168 Transcript_16034/m.47168 type:complete len:238 (+) Transcript_16034:1253-1966(+)